MCTGLTDICLNPDTAGVLELVTREGFDIRVSNLGGSLGAGTYFAEHISYSLAYVVRVSCGAVAFIFAVPAPALYISLPALLAGVHAWGAGYVERTYSAVASV